MNPMAEAELHEFLVWFKSESERHWAGHDTKLLPGLYPSPGYTTSDWYRGTRWQPYTEPQVAALEKRWGLEFPWDYRLFLQVLGTPDCPQLVSGFRDGDMLEVWERDSFMNWRADDLTVADRLNWPAAGLIEGTERPWWWTDKWGAWHTDPWEMDPSEAVRKVLRVTRAAPQLIPFYAHRFLVTQQGQPSACLSVMGSDIIIYGVDLRAALLTDFANLVSAPPVINFPTFDELNLLKLQFWGHFL